MIRDNPCHINIYCDESRHTNRGDSYMVIGATSCPRDQKADIFNKIYLLKKKYNTWREFGWKTLSPNRRNFYWSLIDLFCIETNLTFRCIVVNRDNFDHDQYNLGDDEL